MKRCLTAVLGWGAFAVLFAAQPAVVLAQAGGATVKGVVNDESGAALPGATVTLTGPGPVRTAITAGDGSYTFSNLAAGTYKLAASLTGFGTATQDVTVGAGAAVSVPPVALHIALRGEEVVVTASKVESSLANAPATMTVVGPEQLATSPAQNYGDLLRSVPGLNIIQMSARDINITSRQATSTLSNSQLALLDGRSIYLDFFGLILWDLVPSNPADIKQIEVVRGPASAVWGANALTGVVNIITKSPREAPGGNITLSGGMFERPDSDPADSGTMFGGSFSWAGAPNDTWSYRLAGGYFKSEAFSRPTGRIPVVGGPAGTRAHPIDNSVVVGGGVFPPFNNTDTKQPKFDLRVDQELSNGGRVSYSGGYAGTEGIVHTGIGPFNLQNGSYLGYGRVGYTKGGFKIAAFSNFLDGEAPNLLAVDASGRPIVLDFKTQTHDLEVGHTMVVKDKHILTFGGNARRNNFDITIAPASEDRNEYGAYFQDEIFWDKFRLTLGGRVDKFGNLEDPVFSPRLAAIVKPAPAHSFRLSYNRAFRSPSTINNYLDVTVVSPVNLQPVLTGLTAAGLGALVPLIRPILAPTATGGLFPLAVRAAGSEVVGRPITEERLTAYEIGYTGTFRNRTTVGLAFYINDTDDNINFIGTPRRPEYFYSAANLPPGMAPLRSVIIPVPGLGLVPLSNVLFGPGGALANRLPNTFTYENIGEIRNKGVEASVDHSFSKELSGFANYSWQGEPEPRDSASDPNRYPVNEIGLPAEHRVNVGVNYNGKKWLGSLSVNYTSEAFWTDVLDASTHGFTDDFTMVNATVGLKFGPDGRVTAALKGTNLLNEDIQQHIFGDIMKRSLLGELRVKF